MYIKESNFVGSSVDVKDCPSGGLPEYAFIGRSNVGKSSLLNMITSRKNLARISHTPGKTRTINHFLVNTAWYLVDLPGYGYAKISKKERNSWKKMIYDYLLKRLNLMCVFVLVDARHDPQNNDLEFINWLGAHSIPFVLVFTKADKPKKSELRNNIDNFKKSMLQDWEKLPDVFITSAISGEGKEQVLDFIQSINKKDS